MCLYLVLLDIDECSSSPCQFEGSCNDGVNGYDCTCEPGYTGVHCQTGRCGKFVINPYSFD